MDIDYMSEIRSLDAWEEIHPLSATAYKLMLKLYHFAELDGWPERFRLSNAVLCARCGCSENSLNKAKQELVNEGLILYTRGKRRDASPEYAIQYFYLKFCGKTGGKTRGKTGGKTDGKTGGKGLSDEPMSFSVSYPCSNNIYNTTSSDMNLKGCTSYRDRDNERGTTSSVTQKGDENEYDYYYDYHKKRARDEIFARHERQYKSIAKTMADSECAEKVYEDQIQDVKDMIVEAQYPYGLIAEAIGMTVRKYQKDGLYNPIRYTRALLDDWRGRGIYEPEEIWEGEKSEQGDTDRQPGQRSGT